MPAYRIKASHLLVAAMSLGLNGCGVHRLTEGEPDFNTSSLLARQAHACPATATDCIPGAGPMPLVDAIPSGRTPGHGFLYRIFLGWADPTSVAPAQDAHQESTPPGLVTLHIPQACSIADKTELDPLPPPPAADPKPAPATHGKKPAVPAATLQAPHSRAYPATKACFYAMKSLIDDNYREYAITLVHAINYGHLTSDLTVQALTTAATISGGATAKSVLSAVASGVNATRGYVDEDVLYNQSVSLVLNQMDTDRSRLAAVATTALAQESVNDPYTAAQVYNTLLEYYWAGTFSHALDSLKAATGAAKASCKTAALQAQIAKPQPAQGTTPANPAAAKSGGAAAAASPDCSSQPANAKAAGDE